MENYSVTKIPGVYHDHSRRTCIAIRKSKRGVVYYITLRGGKGLHVMKDKEEDFFMKYVYDTSYPVNKAAQAYLNAYKLFGGTQEAFDTLQKIV